MKTTKLDGFARSLLLASALAAATTSAEATVFYWKGGNSTWESWADASKWSVEKDSATNPDQLVPGHGDKLWPFSPTAGYLARWDLGGQTVEISGFDLGEGLGSPVWEPKRIYLKNGTLVVDNPGQVAATKVTEWWFLGNADGTLVFPSGFGAQVIGESGLVHQWTTWGGTFEVYSDEINAYNLNVDIQSGGKLIFAPGAFSVFEYSTKDSWLHNAGETTAPNGIVWNGSGTYTLSGYTKRFEVKQMGGTMLLGGDFTKTTEEVTKAAEMKFSLEGGTLIASNTVRFANSANNFGDEVSAVMPDSKSATVEVVEDSLLDMGIFTFGSGTTLTKTGPGKLRMGVGFPTALAVNAGTLSLKTAAQGLSGVTLAAGTALEFCAADNVINSLANANEMSFALAEGAFASGDVILTSADATLLTVVKDRITGVPAGTDVTLSGMSLRITRSYDTDFTLTTAGEHDLSDSSTWGGADPTGKSVAVVGKGVVAVLKADAPALSLVKVCEGAVLKVVGDVSAMPSVEVDYPGTLRVSDGATLTLGQSDVSWMPSVKSGSVGLPLFEIAGGATCLVPYGMKFKNVDIRLYGTIRADGYAAGANGVTFGYAAAGETTYFAMTSEGGAIVVADVAGVVVPATGGSGWKRFVCPESTGTVLVQGQILLKDTQIPWKDESVSPAQNCYNGMAIGYGNSSNPAFELVLDNTILPLGYANNIAAAATVVCRNGGQLKRPYRHPGVVGDTALSQHFRLVLDNGGFSYPHAQGSMYLSAWDNPMKSVTLRNGGWISTHDFDGGSYNVLTVENDGAWHVPTLPYVPEDKNPNPPDGDPRNWLSAPFKGLKYVQLEKDATLQIVSTDDLEGSQWNRDIALADISFGGSGNLMVTNATPGWSFTVTFVNKGSWATGRLSAADSDDGTPVALLMNDGAYWAGTLVSGNVSFTNRTSAVSPAKAKTEYLALEKGELTIRVWPDGSSDQIEIAKGLALGNGRIALRRFDGGRISGGASFVIGTCPESAVPTSCEGILPERWKLTTEPTAKAGVVALRATYCPPGMAITVR